MRLAELAVYAINGPQLVERRTRLERELTENGVVAEWISDPDAATLDPDTVRRYYRASRLRWRRRTAVTGRIPYRELRAREIAVTVAHIETYRRFVASGRAWALIFEDDADLEPDFAARFDAAFASLPDDADLVYIGSCCGLRIADAEPGRHFYRKDHPATKCSDSYLLSRRAAQTILRTIVPFVLTIDWELNHHLKRHGLVVYRLEPPLVSQGSETGLHTSSLR